METAFDALMAVECRMQKGIVQQIARRNCDNALIQSLNHVLCQCLLRREMVTSPEWQEAWQKFSEAVLRAQQAAQQFRTEIEDVVDSESEATFSHGHVDNRNAQ